MPPPPPPPPTLLFPHSPSSSSSSSFPFTPPPLSPSAPPYSCASRYGLGSVTSRKDGRRKRRLARGESREKRRDGLPPLAPAALRQVDSDDRRRRGLRVSAASAALTCAFYVPFTIAALSQIRLFARCVRVNGVCHHRISSCRRDIPSDTRQA